MITIKKQDPNPQTATYSCFACKKRAVTIGDPAVDTKQLPREVRINNYGFHLCVKCVKDLGRLAAYED